MSVHVIETLSLELRHAHGRAALESQGLHERLLRFLRGEGRQQLALLFDQWGPRLRGRALDRLVLDLGRLHPGQDELEWAQRLRTALEEALSPWVLPSDGVMQALPSQHLLHFLGYLERGHLPWQLSATPQGSLSRWLAWLVQQQGPQLWRALERHPAGPALLRRLREISPHQGLQALLAQRDPKLGRQLEQLDDFALLPLQASGRLSAYERQRLQQTLRAEALDLLWEARGRPLGEGRRRRLLQAMQAQLSRSLGAGWQARLQPLAPEQDEPGLLHELLREHAPGAPAQDLTPDLLASALHTPAAPGQGAPPAPAWEARLQRLRPLLDAGRPLDDAQQARLLRRLQRLAAHHGRALGQHLQQWMQDRSARRRWALALTPASFGGLLGCLRSDSTHSADTLPLPQAAPAVHWAESLRQAALRLQRRAAPGQRPGLSRLQRLLMEACLDAIARGERLPEHHAGWQRFWDTAWQRWEEPDAALQAVPAARPTVSPASPDKQPWLPPAPPRPERGKPADEPAASSLDRALQGLARQCEQGRWQWPQRLRLARLLSSEQACARWVRLFDESRRWRMIRAQFGAVAQPLQQRAGRLLRWLGQAMQEPAAALAEHWRRLCRVLFLQGQQPAVDSLRRAYQQEQPPAQPAPPPVAAHEPIWVDDAGQVLLAVYAERLFKHLTLLDQGRFRDEAARATAVQCLQQLCHSEQAREACDSVLSRLLCGAGPSALLPAVPPLPAETQALLEQLLQAVIAHWKALGHTSVAGLRETFLQRQGRLLLDKSRDDAPPTWRLRVARRGFDVLLDRLPWSFSTIRLPWMEGVLHVEWR